jgi:putative FmdB family regulatory protein
MPLYDYRCADCGEFRAWRSMREAAAPVACPDCQQLAPRAVVAPNLALMQAHTRIAHQRNEKSAHEPRVVSRREQGHGHAGEHGHRHQHKHGVGGRPWMIGH